MKKLLATVTAVVLSLAMVAMPSVAMAETDNPNSNSNSNSNSNNNTPPEPCDQLGYTKFDTSSGNQTLMSGSTVIGTLVWSGTSLTYTLNAGWTIDICIKSGEQVGTEQYNDVSGTSTITIAQNISHIGWKDPKFTEQPTTVTPAYSSTQKSCEVAESTISVTLKTGITYALSGAVVGVIDISSGSSGPLVADTYTLTAVDSDPNDLFIGTPLNVQIVITPFTDTCVRLIDVTPDADFVDESCDLETKTITEGVITVNLARTGATYSITDQNGDPVPFDALTGETGPLKAGQTYTVTATANTGYKLTGPYEEKFTPFSKKVDCTTLSVVTPQASQDPGCELPSFFIIGNVESDPAALTWTANGQPIAEGKHVVNGPVSVHLVAAASSIEHGISEGAQTEWTFKFPKNETCGDLETLALTGASDTTPTLALTAFLGLLGLAMVRSGIRVNRNRQEA